MSRSLASPQGTEVCGLASRPRKRCSAGSGWNAAGRKKEEERIQKAKAVVIFTVQSDRDGRVIKSLERRVADGR